MAAHGRRRRYQLPKPEPKEIDEKLSLQLRHLAEDAVLRGEPNGDERCDNCLYYIEPEQKISYCWHPKLRILVGGQWWCQWWEKQRGIGAHTVRALSLFVLAAVAALPSRAHAEEPRAHAARLIKSAIVVDTHEDVPWELREKWADLGQPGATKHVDIPRLRAGGVGAVFFAVFTPGALADKGQAAHVAFELSDLVDRVVASHPETFAAAGSVAEIRAARKSGRIAILKGIEGGHAIEDSLGLLRQFYRLGVRYMTLTHTNTNNWADSLGDFSEPEVRREQVAQARRADRVRQGGRRSR